ncbi:MAG: VanZ family protein [Marinobacter sp.]|uniref:VanZ family protein n=1 Tax=Marinobacter sp. TaxID=50741 RepID=UPI00299DC39A|nr:VanZ family protein [Marinobacter sp.]MDX1635932.1 VanZ family protein [Marinobacter sp.]
MPKLFTRLLARRWPWRLALAISVAAILFLATTSQTHAVPASFGDKFNHLIAFVELTLLARLGWPHARPLLVATLVLGFGLLLELLQAPLPYRSFSLLDLAADAAGIGLGLALSPWLLARAQRAPGRPSAD